MKTAIKYTQKEKLQKEIEPVRIDIKFSYVIFTMPDGKKYEASPPWQEVNTFATIENNQLRFNTELVFKARK